MLFSILIFDEPNTAELRDIHRKDHLDYLKEFDDQTMFAGPFTTDDESADLGGDVLPLFSGQFSFYRQEIAV